NVVLLNPVPGPSPERLVQIAERNYTQGLFREENRMPFFVGVSPPVLEAVSANQELFTQFAWADQISLQRKTEDFIEEEGGHVVSPNFFALWNVPPLLGRTFAKDEVVALNANRKPVHDTVIVLSYDWWKSIFGADPNVVGRAIEMGGIHFTVI